MKTDTIFKNSTGEGWDISGLVGDGLTLLNTTLAGNAANSQAKTAAQIEQTKLSELYAQKQLADANAANAVAQSAAATSKIKAYAIPIVITGAVVVAGIAAYFVFKKKES